MTVQREIVRVPGLGGIFKKPGLIQLTQKRQPVTSA